MDYDYLVTGEVSEIRENGASSGIGVLARYVHDDLGRLVHAVYGNGTASNFDPDPVGRLRQFYHNLDGASADLTATFTFNPAGQIASVQRSNDAYSWTGAVDATRAYTANGLNQYTAAGAVTFAYDARGNLTRSGSDTYAYTSENLLKSGPGVSLAYDPLMRLAQVTGTTTTRFGYDGLDMVAEYNASGTMLRRYVHAPGIDTPIVWYEGSGTSDRRWLHADERGSIVAISDDTGAPLAINSYDEYGIPGAGNIGRFQYTGQAWLPDLGLYYYKARMYSPTLGRFMQTDPIGYADGMNLYAYVGSDPINFVDPLGLATVTCTGSILRHESCGEVNGWGCIGNCAASLGLTYNDAADKRKGGQAGDTSIGQDDSGDSCGASTGDEVVVCSPRLPRNEHTFDPPCKPGVDCKLTIDRWPCDITNNFCDSDTSNNQRRKPQPKPRDPAPPRDWKFAFKCASGGLGYAGAVAVTPPPVDLVVAITAGPAAIANCIK